MRFPYALLCLICLGFLSSCERGTTSLPVLASYSFERDGISTVNYTGQRQRLEMGAELAAALLDPSYSTEALLEMFANQDEAGNPVDPFVDPELNATQKSIRSKVAASHLYFSGNTVASASIREEFEDWIEAQATEVLPFTDSLAAPGAAGQIADGSTPRYVNAQGFEYDQFIIKGLNGALILDQILNHYLDPGVLDAGNAREDQLAEVVVSGQAYTAMEHHWDEAYGYLFGGAEQGSLPLSTLGQDDVFMNKYLGRVVGDTDFETYATDLFEAFALGRAAIVAGDFDLRDAQAAIIKERLSAIIGIRAVYYLKVAAVELAAGNYGSAFHDIGEGYGFIYSLQFTQDPATSQPYFSADEVEAILEDLVDDGSQGLWDLQTATLDALAEDIAARFDFTVAQTID